jgi:hypothetical protein
MKIILLIVAILATISSASAACLSKSEARAQYRHHIYWHNSDSGRCWDDVASTRSSRRHHHEREHEREIKIAVPLPLPRPDAAPALAAFADLWTERVVEPTLFDIESARIGPWRYP